MSGRAAPTIDEGVEAYEMGQYRRARAAFEAGVERDDPAAHAYLALLLWYGRGGLKADPNGAVHHLKRAASAGFAPAQINLGVAHRLGLGVDQDDDAAVALFEKAALQGAPRALTELGACARLGEGMPEDAVRARKYWTKAADMGDPAAMAALGAAIAEGRGGPADFVTGLAWLYAAAAVGADEAAARSAVQLARRMRARDIAEARKRGRTLVKRFRDGRHMSSAGGPLPRPVSALPSVDKAEAS